MIQTNLIVQMIVVEIVEKPLVLVTILIHSIRSEQEMKDIGANNNH